MIISLYWGASGEKRLRVKHLFCNNLSISVEQLDKEVSGDGKMVFIDAEKYTKQLPRGHLASEEQILGAVVTVY